MTNHIEEMMRTAGIKPKYIYTVTGQATTLRVDANWLIWKFKDRKKKSVFKVVKVNKYNPDFTAEKQLEIIKLIASKETYSDEVAEFAIYHKNNLWGFEFFVEGGYTAIEFKNQDFTQALAQLTTKLMKANELDKEKVKGIIEG